MKIESQQIRQLAGATIFSVEFIKRTTGDKRRMVCRLGVRSKVTGVGRRFNPDDHNLLGVYDMQKRAYRFINLDGLQKLKIRGETYLLPTRARKK